MSEKIKQFIAIILIIFCVTLLFIAIGAIWNFMSYELAKEALIKVSCTFGVIVIISLAIMLISKMMGDKK